MTRRFSNPPDADDEFADSEHDSQVRVKALWAHYKQTGDRSARDELIIEFSPLVRQVAARVGAGLPSQVEHADLISYGVFGLIDAIDKYDPQRPVKFETYAISRIRGAIIDELRSLDWIPRSIRSRAREVEQAHADLEAKLHRTPTDEEMAQYLEISAQEFRTTMNRISNVNLVALDEVTSAGADRTESMTLVDTLHDSNALDPAGSMESEETQYLLARAIDQLGEREKFVLTLYYFENMTLAEIGTVLGVTESRISQMHTKAVKQLRERLASE